MRLRVDDELAGERLGSHVGDARRGRLRPGYLEDLAEHVVHGEEGGGHAGARGQELATAHAVLGGQIAGELFHPRLDPALLAGLGHRVVLAVGHDLGRHRPAVRGDLGRRRALQLVVTEVVRHRSPPGGSTRPWISTIAFSRTGGARARRGQPRD